MVSSQPLLEKHSSAALAARERLLHDPQIRRNRSLSPEPSVTATFTPEETSLSHRDQEQQAIAIARAYKQYYLAEITYQAHRREVVALIKPLHSVQADPLQIIVDANGNATIETVETSQVSPRNRLLVLISILATITAIVTILIG